MEIACSSPTKLSIDRKHYKVLISKRIKARRNQEVDLDSFIAEKLIKS